MNTGLQSTQTTVNREGEWRSRLAVFVSGLLLFELISGLWIWLMPFSISNQFQVIIHTVVGVLFLVPYMFYQMRHWLVYRNRPWSHYMVTGYVAFAAILLNVISGIVLTVQAAFGSAVSWGWDTVHIITTLAILAFLIPHVILLFTRDSKGKSDANRPILAAERRWAIGVLSWTVAGYLVVGACSMLYQPMEWVNEFPEGYEVEEGKSPFAPSLGMTASGGAYDDRSLTGSESCGTSRCHEAIYKEWAVSAHRWSSMDPAFQVVQEVMAKQNGPTSTRYCGGCHDPASLFAGTKNILTEDLSSVLGYDEGVSCLVCHSIRETDLKGNANYIIDQPQRYIYEVKEGATAKFISDFLIRAYPKKHLDAFSKRLFKTPEYCAACHKQFIDQDVNKVGWVQLQNQFDNWRTSKWNPVDQPDMVVECRECHMPLEDTYDPASGDELDSYRTKNDGQHRDHRFIAANSFIPTLLQLDNWEEHRDMTEAWLQGKRDIPEIEFKWAAGPAVAIEIDAPDTVRMGEDIAIRVIISSNKVGHDFPTGPLDIIQSWINLEVTDHAGNVLLSSGTVDEEHFIKPGSYMFKAEPVDRYGNLIDRHNLWEMVGVRYRRAIFPGFSDVANYALACPSTLPPDAQSSDTPISRDFKVDTGNVTGSLQVKASLDYRKVDQYLLNFVFGEDNQVTAPIIKMTEEAKTIWVAAS